MNTLVRACKSWYEFGRWLKTPRRLQEGKSLPLAIWLNLCRNGFFPNKQQLYQLDKNDRKLFMSDKQMLMSAKIDGEYSIILNDKVLFELVMQPFVSVPHNFTLIHQGRLIWLDNELGSAPSLSSLIRKRKKLIAKPTYGMR